nr:hypothetical protein [Tanacetum cinerariifolium]
MHVVPTTVLTRSILVLLTAARHITTAVPQTTLSHHRPTKHGVNKAHSPIRRPINHIPSPKNSNFHQKVTTVKANQVNVVQEVKGNWIQVSYGLGPQKTLTFLFNVHGNPQHALKEKGVIDSCCLRHMIGNISYLSDFEKSMKDMLPLVEIQKVVRSQAKVKSGQLPDENHVLLRVPRDNNMYNVDLKNIVPSGDLTYLFAKATLDESNLWHRRPGHINLKVMNKLVKDPLGNFDRKADEGFLVGYSVSSKAFRVFNSRTKIVQETLHVNFLENKSNVAGSGHTWLFDIDTLTESMNYQPVVARDQPNSSAGIQENLNACTLEKEATSVQQYVLLPVWSSGSNDPQNTDATASEVKEHESAVYVSPSSCNKPKTHDEKTKREAKGKSLVELSTRVRDLRDEFQEFSDNNTNGVNTVSTSVTVVVPNSTDSTNSFSDVGSSNNVVSSNFDLGGKSSFVDLSQYLDDPDMPALEDITYSDDEEDVGAEADFSKLETNITVSPIPTTRVHKDHPVTQIIGDLSLAPQTRIMTMMVKKQGGASSIQDVKGLSTSRFVKGNKARLVAHGHTQKEGIDYEEFFALVARMEAIRLFIEYTSFMGFMVYQMDDKSAFLYGTIKEEVNVCQPLRFEDPDYPDKVYKVVKALYRLHQAPRACQDKYVAEILRKFGLTDEKSTSTPIDTEKPLLKDPNGEDVDVHTYRSMIGSLMYLTSSRPDIMFVVCACARFQVTPKASHLHAIKRIFRYLKGKPLLGLWYPKDSPFNLVAYSDSDYTEASLDRKSITGDASEGFEQIINFLNTHVIQYALMVNPTIYVSCIKQFWTSVFIKKSNDVVRLQALIDRKKVIITEDSIRQYLRLDDADSVDCLPNEEIFAGLARMGYEKPSTKLTFYKAFFSAQWKFLIHIILQYMSAKRTA